MEAGTLIDDQTGDYLGFIVVEEDLEVTHKSIQDSLELCARFRQILACSHQCIQSPNLNKLSTCKPIK